MLEVVNKMIFPAPEASYSITTRNPGARLVHIRRPNNSHRFTVGYYLSPTLARMDSAGIPASSCSNPSSPRTRKDGGSSLPSTAARGRYTSAEAGRAPPSHLLLYAHPNACDIGMLLGELQFVSSMCNIDVLIWEFRGYGMCGAGDDGVEPSEMDLYRDMEATFEFATKNLGFPPNRIILSGRSIGTGPTVQLASFLPNKYRQSVTKEEVGAGGGPLAGIFLQCPFTSIQDSVDSLVDINAIKYTKGLFTGSIKSIARSVVSDRFRSIDVIEHLFWPREASSPSSSSSTAPMNASVSRLVIQHGSDDGIVPLAHSLALVEKIRARVANQLGITYPFPTTTSSSSQQRSSSSSAFNLMGSHYDGGRGDAEEAAVAAKKKEMSPEEATLKEAVQAYLHLEVCEGEGHNDLSVETMAELLSEHIVDPSNILLNSTKNTTPPSTFSHVDALLRLETYCAGPSFFWQVYAADDDEKSGDASSSSSSALTTLGEWTHSVLPRALPDISRTLREFGGNAAVASGGGGGGDLHMSSSSPLQDVCRVHPATQHQLAQIMTASFCAFMNHVAIRWLRAKQLAKLRQQRDSSSSRPALADRHNSILSSVAEYYSAVDQHPPTASTANEAGVDCDGGVTNRNAAVGGGAPVDLVTANRQRAPLIETASLAVKTKDLTTGFILEHIALYGNPLAIYLLPSLQPPPPTRDDGDSKSNISSPNVVAFGGLIKGSSIMGGDRTMKKVPYASWYTHTIFEEPNTTADTSDQASTSSNPAATTTTASPTFASSKKMKRLTERLPRVPLFEYELTNNLMVLMKSFLDSLLPSESGLQSLNEFELNDLCGVVAVEHTALRLSERQVDKIQVECERIILAILEEEMKEVGSTTRGGEEGGGHPLLSQSILSTLLRPVLRFVTTSPTGEKSNNKDDGNKEEDNLLTDLYLPNTTYNSTLPMPIVVPNRLLSSLESDFAREYYCCTGDLVEVVKSVERRLADAISGVSPPAPPPAPNSAIQDVLHLLAKEKADDDEDEDDADAKLQYPRQDSYAAMIFTLQGALLRNSPESLVGAVGDTSHYPTFMAVRLLTTIYYRHYLPNEALRPSLSTLSWFRTPPASNILSLLQRSETTPPHPQSSTTASSVSRLNRVFVPAMIGGSGVDVLAYLKEHMKGSTNDAEKDSLMFITPGGKTSASGSGDCVIM